MVILETGCWLLAQPRPRKNYRQGLSAYEIAGVYFKRHLLTLSPVGEIRCQTLVESKWKFIPGRSDSRASWLSVIMNLQIRAVAL